MPPTAPVIGIDLGGTNIQVGVVGERGKVVARSKAKTKADQGSQRVIERLVAGVDSACEHAGIDPASIAAVGIGAPGTIDPATGVVIDAVNLRWNDVPLAAILSERLAGRPVVVDNDVNCAIYGEWKLGAARGHDDAAGIWLGTGIGGGLILAGSLYHGHFNTAGEIGHTVLFPGAGPAWLTLEQNCARTAVAEQIAKLIRSNEKSAITDIAKPAPDKIRSKVIAAAYAAGDPLTREVVDHAADLVGIAAANLVTLLSIPLIVLGGGLTEAIGAPLIERVEANLRRHVFPDRCRAAKVVSTELFDDAGVIGAALLARESLRG